jgi:hypothetical protein
MGKDNIIDFKKKDVLYYANISHPVGYYNLCELIIRTIADDYFVGTDKKDKHAYLFSYNDYNKIIFKDRKKALKVLKEAEKNRRKISDETCYEEY